MLRKHKSIASGTFTPFLELKDEQGSKLTKEQREFYVKEANQYLEQYTWESIRACEYLEFFRNGNRSNLQKKYFEKRTVLIMTMIAECLEAKGRYLDFLVDGVWSICEESSWVIPAHNNHFHVVPGTYHVLPDLEEELPFVDLFAAETASCLAFAHYFLKEKFDVISPLIGKRIVYEVKKRVLTPYMRCEEYHWMGLGSHRADVVNNWNPWINSNCLTAVLLLEDSDAVKEKTIIKIMDSLSTFINGYGIDGGCNEGPHYWEAAAGSLFDCLEMLYEYSKGAIDIYKEPLIHNMGRYIQRLNVANEYFINYADGSTKNHAPGELIYRYGQRIQDKNLEAFGISMFGLEENLGMSKPLFMMHRYISNVLHYSKMLERKGEVLFEKSVWMEQLQVMVSRQEEHGGNGFCLSTKGGHNGESHNHNDVGNYVVYYRGKPVIIDVGVEIYTAKTFSPQRYEIWTMQSNYHNIAIINGQGQRNGAEYKASEVSFRTLERKESLSMQLKDTYNIQAGIKSYERVVEFDRSKENKGIIRICDEIELLREENEIQWVLMVCCKPYVEQGGRLFLQNEVGDQILLQYNLMDTEILVEEIKVEDVNLKKDWGNSIYRILFTLKKQKQDEVEFQVTMTSTTF